MKVKIRYGVNCDDLEWQEMWVNNRNALDVYPLCECPEDAIIGRDLVSCDDVLELMQEAYKAGKNGEELLVIKENEERDES